MLHNLRYVGEITDPAMLAAAVLHDLVEVGSATVAQIESRFGPEVAGLVAELTRREPTADETKDLTRDQIRDLRAEILRLEILHMSPPAQIIKLADRLSNLREGRRTKTPKAFQRYVKYTLAILEGLPPGMNTKLYEAILRECQVQVGKKRKA